MLEACPVYDVCRGYGDVKTGVEDERCDHRACSRILARKAGQARVCTETYVSNRLSEPRRPCLPCIVGLTSVSEQTADTRCSNDELELLDAFLPVENILEYVEYADLGFDGCFE